MSDLPEEGEQARRSGERHRRLGEDDVYSLEGEDDFGQVEEELVADRRDEAIEEMVSWFERNFEDPGIRTPRDGGDQQHVFLWGGPFDAAEVLEGEFTDRFEPEWITEAVERVEGGTEPEWAPAPDGDFFEDMEDDRGGTAARFEDFHDRQETAAAVLDRLQRLEAVLAELRDAPPPPGHNRPSASPGGPPFGAAEASQVAAAIADVRRELASAAPSPQALKASEGVLHRVGVAVAKWVGRKADLAIDEGIKLGIQVVKWKVVAALMIGAAAGITHWTGLPPS